jgi:hypothetical protein
LSRALVHLIHTFALCAATLAWNARFLVLVPAALRAVQRSVALRLECLKPFVDTELLHTSSLSLAFPMSVSGSATAASSSTARAMGPASDVRSALWSVLRLLCSSVLHHTVSAPPPSDDGWWSEDAAAAVSGMSDAAEPTALSSAIEAEAKTESLSSSTAASQSSVSSASSSAATFDVFAYALSFFQVLVDGMCIVSPARCFSHRLALTRSFESLGLRWTDSIRSHLRSKHSHTASFHTIFAPTLSGGVTSAGSAGGGGVSQTPALIALASPAAGAPIDSKEADELLFALNVSPLLSRPRSMG